RGIRDDFKKKLSRYQHNSCRNQVSIFKKTLFEGCKVPVNKILLLCYLYLLGIPVNRLIEATGLSSATKEDIYANHISLQKVHLIYLDELRSSDQASVSAASWCVSLCSHEFPSSLLCHKLGIE
ncbi:hypothetical protein HZS_5322, partial [Henneguya salminicola]